MPAVAAGDMVIVELGGDGALEAYTSESAPPTAANDQSASTTDTDRLELVTVEWPKEEPIREEGSSVPTVVRPQLVRSRRRHAPKGAIASCLVVSLLAVLVWRWATTSDAPLLVHVPDVPAVDVATAPTESRVMGGPLATEERPASEPTRPAASSGPSKTASDRRERETRASVADAKVARATGPLPRDAIRTRAANVGNVERQLVRKPMPAAPLVVDKGAAVMNRAVALPPADLPPTLTPVPAAPSPATAANSPALGNTPTTSSASVPPSPTSAAPTPSGETADIQAVLARYVSAFRELDAGAVSDVWPSVDSRALARAFRGLEQQEIAFDGCNITTTDGSARASCGGTVRYVTRVGDKGPRVESRRWQFDMQKVGERWVIEGVESR